MPTISITYVSYISVAISMQGDFQIAFASSFAYIMASSHVLDGLGAVFGQIQENTREGMAEAVRIGQHSRGIGVVKTI